MVVGLVERQPFEPEIVGYLRVDPPVPLMHRRINGEIVSRVVIHPDCRGDGLGMTIVRSAIEWVDGCDVPEMRKGKRMVETVAQMARYHSFFERVVPPDGRDEEVY